MSISGECENWFKLSVRFDVRHVCNNRMFVYRVDRVPRTNCTTEVYPRQEVYISYAGSTAAFGTDFTGPRVVIVGENKQYVDFIISVTASTPNASKVVVSIDWF